MQFFPVQTLMSVNLVWTTVTKMLTVLIQKAVTCAYAEKATVAMEQFALVSFVVNYSNSHDVLSSAERMTPK